MAMLLQMPVAEWPKVPAFPFLSGQQCDEAPSAARVTAPPTHSAGFSAIPSEVLSNITAVLGRAQPVGSLANSCRSLSEHLVDASGRLRVAGIVTTSLSSAILGCSRASTDNLEVIRVDLNAEVRDRLRREEIDRFVRLLSALLINAARLRVLVVLLASFDNKMERLRLSRFAWEALVHGLGSLGKHGQLKTLGLSSVAIKATQPSSSPPVAAAPLATTQAGPMSFPQAISRLTSLEELSVTHGEIFGAMAKLLNKVLSEDLHNLRSVDFTRNHIPKQVIMDLRSSLPAKVAVCGAEQQTFFFY